MSTEGYRHPHSMECPHCGKNLDGTHVADENGINDDATGKPEIGQLGLCAYCAGIQVYGENEDGTGFLRKPTPEEEEEAKRNPVIAQMQAVLLDIKYRSNADGTGVDPELDTDPDNVPDDKWVFKLAIVREDDTHVASRMKSRVPKEMVVSLLEGLLAEMKGDWTA